MRRIAGLAVAGCFVVAACGSTASTESSGSNDTAAEYESPLNDFLGIDYSNNNDDQQAQAEEQQRQVNESVLACMAAEGFEWIPDDQNMVSFDGTPADGLEYGSRAWIEKYGFGMSTQMFSQSQLGPDLVGYDDSQNDTGEEYVDPNATYLEGLSEAEQMAFNEALYGSDQGPEYDESLTDEEMNQIYEDYYNSPDYKPTGCYNIASEEAYSGGEFAVYEVFSDELNEMYERIQADPRIQAAEAKIAECMTGKGLAFTNMDAVYEDFNTRTQPLWETMPDPAAGLTEEQMAEMTDADWQALYENPPPLPDDVMATIAELQKEEIAMAIALDDCGGGWSNQESVYNDVRIELEQEFIDTHRDELEKLKSGN